jgi:hypothetical protein
MCAKVFGTVADTFVDSGEVRFPCRYLATDMGGVR